MHPIRKKAQPVAVFMIILTMLLSVPYQSAVAALVGTETMLDMSGGQEARATLKQFMVRNDVRSAIVSQGVDPLEADARLNSLTDAEVIQLADQIDQLPAGGDVLGLVIAVLVIVILVLVIIRLI
ncbi:MAG: PA2779 family protein [Deltaproteobacteria bacterium]|nr:PA2779 family protein [Deltaproteobacteria bacterium]